MFVLCVQRNPCYNVYLLVVYYDRYLTGACINESGRKRLCVSIFYLLMVCEVFFENRLHLLEFCFYFLDVPLFFTCWSRYVPGSSSRRRVCLLLFCCCVLLLFSHIYLFIGGFLMPVCARVRPVQQPFRRCFFYYNCCLLALRHNSNKGKGVGWGSKYFVTCSHLSRVNITFSD